MSCNPRGAESKNILRFSVFVEAKVHPQTESTVVRAVVRSHGEVTRLAVLNLCGQACSHFFLVIEALKYSLACIVNRRGILSLQVRSAIKSRTHLEVDSAAHAQDHFVWPSRTATVQVFQGM